MNNTQYFEIQDVKYGRSILEKGIILGQRNYRWTLKRKHNPFYAKSKQGEYLNELTPHKKNFQIYIPAAKLEPGMEFLISKSEYKNPEKVVTTYRVKDITAQFVECEILEEQKEQKKKIESLDVKSTGGITGNVFGPDEPETEEALTIENPAESVGDWFEMMSQGIDLDDDAKQEKDDDVECYKKDHPIEATEIETVQEPLETRVLNVIPLSPPPKHIDEIANDAGATIQEALSTLTMLDLKDKVKQLPGMSYILKEPQRPYNAKTVKTPKRQPKPVQRAKAAQKSTPKTEQKRGFTRNLWNWQSKKHLPKQQTGQINLLYCKGEQTELF